MECINSRRKPAPQSPKIGAAPSSLFEPDNT
jgi:hypothetical protein